jgi:hypothetical protein
VRVLVLGAGGPAGVSTCRALVAAGHDVFAYDDENPAHLVWPGEIGAQVLGRNESPSVDVVIPQPDSLVRWVAAGREWFAMKGEKLFLPSLETIDRCQAKVVAVNIWHKAGLRGPALEIVVPYPDMLHLAADRLGLPFWLRANRGTGANKAIRVGQVGEAFHWIRFWESRGEQVEWIAEPYLPGRDLAWSSIWYEGELVTCFARERVEYLYPQLSPEGLTGTPTIACVICETGVTECGVHAVLAVDEKPHGIFSVDMREDADGVPRPTEINAGRSFTTLGLWSLYGPNFTDIAASCAIEPPDAFNDVDPLPAGLTLSRHIDCGHVFTEALVLA